MEEKMVDLRSMIDEFADQPDGPAIPTKVILGGSPNKETERASVALQNMGDHGRVEFLKGLLYLWRGAFPNDLNKERALEQLHKIFGDKMNNWLGLRLMYTLTAGGEQFRCWHGKPGGIRPNHVDSCGEGLLFEIVGTPNNVGRYIDALLSERDREKVITLPNGVKIWGFYWSR